MKIDGKEIKGVIFDLDGTLLDSTSIWVDVDIAFFKKRNIPFPTWYGEAIGHIGLDKAADFTIETFHLNEKKEDIIKEWKESVLDLYANKVLLKPGAKEFLEALNKENIPFCAATANDEDCYKSALMHNGIYEMFKFVLEVGNFKNGKDKPDVYYEAAKRLGVNVENCVIFEDLITPIKTAKSANFITVAVYDKLSKDIEEIKNIAHCYIKDFRELL